MPAERLVMRLELLSMVPSLVENGSCALRGGTLPLPKTRSGSILDESGQRSLRDRRLIRQLVLLLQIVHVNKSPDRHACDRGQAHAGCDPEAARWSGADIDH